MNVDLAGFVDGVPERFVPDIMRGQLVDAEHRARYWWAADLVAGKRVLDAGCGIGYGSAILADGGADGVVGVDVAASVIEAARPYARPGVSFDVGDVESLDFDDSSFDVIVSFEVIEHLRDFTRALDEFRRVLRPGGVLAVSSPNPAVYPPGNPHHARELLPEELRAALGERLQHVVLLRQHDWVASALLDDDAYSDGDAGVVAGVEVRKIAGREPGSELYTLALASDDPIELAPRLAMLAEPLEFRRWLDMFQTQQDVLHRQVDYITRLKAGVHERDDALERLEEAERLIADREELLRSLHELRLSVARAATLRVEAAAALYRAEMSERALRDVVDSASWRITAPLRIAKRLLLGPRRPLAPGDTPHTPDEWLAWLDERRGES